MQTEYEYNFNFLKIKMYSLRMLDDSATSLYSKG